MLNINPAVLTLPKSIERMIELLTEIRDTTRARRDEKPPERPAARAHWTHISSQGNQQALQIPIEGHVVGILIGGDTAGRGTINLSQRQYSFWVAANESILYRLTLEDQLVIKNERLSYTPPVGTTGWDVTIIMLAR